VSLSIAWLDGMRLSVCVTAVANSNDINQAVSVRDAIHHTPLTHTDTPEIARTLQLYDSGWAGVSH